MIDEEEIFALMQAAKDQQAAVERATQAMQTQRGELYDAITQLTKVQATVTAAAKLGAERGLSVRLRATPWLTSPGCAQVGYFTVLRRRPSG